MTLTISAAEFERVACFHNESRQAGPYPEELQAVLDRQSCRQAQNEIRCWPGYAPSPLVRLDGLARKLGVGALYYKDESGRFGLGSFKALGGAYQVMRVLQQDIARRHGREVPLSEIRDGTWRDTTGDVTVVTATDGNHGRSVAWGAQQFGCRARIYIHAEVSESRRQAMAALGAEVIRIDGGYDDSVRLAASEAQANNWVVVSDTSYEGYLELPRFVMQGYSVMAEEMLEQLAGLPAPTHFLVQGGVGGIAATLCAVFWEHYGEQRPRFMVVEPDLAPCLYESARAGRPTAVAIEHETVMAGLSCGEISVLAWPILAAGADDFVTVPDALVAPMMRLLADGQDGDRRVVAGESAVAGLAAVAAAGRSPDLSAALGLNQDSRILLVGTEGATDPLIYREIVGADPSEIAGQN